MIEQLLGMPKSQVMFDLAARSAKATSKRPSQGEPDHRRRTIRRCAHRVSDRSSAESADPANVRDGFDLVEVPGLRWRIWSKQAEQFDPVVLSQDIAILEELRRTSANRRRAGRCSMRRWCACAGRSVQLGGSAGRARGGNGSGARTAAA